MHFRSATLLRSRWALLALLAGLLLRSFFLLFHAHILGDSLVYADLAANLLRHHTFGLTEGPVVRPTLIRMPGYPLFLAACFALFGIAKYNAILWLQAILDLAGCVLLATLAGRLFGPRPALCTLWLAALCPFTANYVAAPLTETLAIFCAIAGLFALERWLSTQAWRWVVLLGSSIAVAVLLRPDRALLGVALIGAMLPSVWRRPTLARALLAVCLIVAAPLSIWTARNWRAFHVFQPLSPKYANDPGEFVSLGFNRWYRTWAVEFYSTVKVYWEWDGDLLHPGDLPARAFDSPAQRARTLGLIAQYNDVSAATPALDRQFAALAADRIRAHPLRYYVELPLGRLLNMWLRPRTEMLRAPLDWWRVSAHPRLSLFPALYAALNLGFLLLAAAGVRRWLQSGADLVGAAALAYVVLRSVLLMTVDNSEPRYTIDAYPVVLFFAGLALAAILRPSTAPPSYAAPS